jgi:DNA mismatch repair ATPase MutS
MESTYLQRAEDFKAEADKLHARYNRYAFIRLALFIVAIGIAIYLFTAVSVSAGIGFVLVFLAGFYRFIRWHQRIQENQLHHEHLSKVNEWEAACLKHDYQQYQDGAAFLDVAHPYAVDLDLFGPFSVFQYLNRASTALGRQKLAQWLTQPASPEEIRSRQAAAEELREMLDWRQHFQAYGIEAEDQLEQIEMLEAWLEMPAYVSNQKWLGAMLYIIPVWSVIAIVLWALYLPWYIAILLFLPAIWILRKYVERVNKTHIQTTHAENALAHYSKLIAHIEPKAFKSPLLSRLHESLAANGQSASSSIQRLSYIISQLNVRYNAFAIVLNVLMLWDLQWVYRLEKWKAAMKPHLSTWFEVLASFEALSSYGNVWYNNKAWTMPLIHQQALVDAQEVGHPLIHASKRVCNSIQIPTDGHIKLVTGSNMAGKSTFLRTLGINAVLAMAGAPVCAEKLRLPPLSVYTSMRTQDALHESTSSFYAELKRLKVIIEAVEATADNEPPSLQTFFLLDEILKGTNSNDRHTGSKALIQQLIRSRGSGIIATHDLELGSLEATAGGAIENLRIEVEIQNGQLHFDYKLKKGVSQSFNATLLMKRMGIKIDDESL